MTNCSTCGSQSWLCQACKLEDLEDRLGTAADRDIDVWILEADLWHASTAFDGETHECACGTEIETPLERSAEDLRYVPDEFDAPVCEGCVDELEEPRQETIPADANFERASKLVTDGGVDVDAVREGIDYWIRSTYCTNGRAIHIPSKDSTRDDPETPCSHSARSGGWRTVDIDHYPDDHLAERLCTDCVAIATGTGPDRSDVDYSRTPMDVLREAGLEPDDDREVVTDGGIDEIVPEDFDLEAAKNAHSTTSPDERKRCPECKRSTVCRKIDDHRKREIDTEYYCIQCLTHFDEPLTENPFTDGGTEDDRDVATDGGLEEVYRRETISEGADGGLQIGDRETVEEIDDVCAALEAIRADVENPDIDDALQTAISHAWQASVLQRVDENTDVRVITSSGSSGVAVHGPDPAEFEREVSDQ